MSGKRELTVEEKEEREWKAQCELKAWGDNIIICEVSGGLLHNGIYLIMTHNTEKTIKEMTEAYRCQVTLLKEYERRWNCINRFRHMAELLREHTVVHEVKWNHLGTALDIRNSALSPVEKIETLVELKPGMTAGTMAYRIEI